MKKHLLLTSAALFGSLPAQGILPRDPNPPLPPTNTTLTSTAPQVPLQRAWSPPMQSLAPSPQPRVVDPARRNSRRPEATFEHLVTSVMFDRPEANGPLWALGHDWKARFDGDSFTFIPFFGATAPQNYPMRLALAGVAVGGEQLELAPGQPIASGFTVRTARGALVEVADLTLQQVEQSFVFEALPNRGAIAVEIGISTDLGCEMTESGLRFRNEHGSVDYRKAIAFDAGGASLPLDIVWTGGSARIEIPAAFVAKAQLPLVLDPLLSVNHSLTPGQTQLQRDPDVATIQSAGGRTIVVWRREYSATDHDCFASILDANLVPISAPLTIDYSTYDWLTPAVAGNDYAQNFLVVCGIRDGTVNYIGGRVVSASGVLGSVFDIERQGIIGLPGNNFRPDVGSDPYPGFGYYCVVFEKQNAGAADIYFKVVTPSGTVPTGNPTALDVATTTEGNPTISKSCGSFNGLGSHWFVSWQRTYPFSPFDQEVIGAMVNWNGAVQVPFIYVAASPSEDTAPATSSPADINGVRYWMVSYETAPAIGQQRNIVCAVYDNTGAFQQSVDLSQAEGVGTALYDQIGPDVDSDGARFAVCYAEPYLGLYDLDTRVSTVAYLPTTNSLRIDESRINLGGTSADEFAPRVCADSSGGVTVSARYVIVDANYGANDIEAYAYGGYSPGAQFSYYPSQCGVLSIYPSGSTALGSTITIQVSNGPLSGTIFGYPGVVPLNPLGCNCVLGVDQGLFYGNPFVWTVPVLPQFVGYVFSVQGWTIVGTQCLGTFDLSDTVDFTIR